MKKWSYSELFDSCGIFPIEQTPLICKTLSLLQPSFWIHTLMVWSGTYLANGCDSTLPPLITQVHRGHLDHRDCPKILKKTYRLPKYPDKAIFLSHHINKRYSSIDFPVSTAQRQNHTQIKSGYFWSKREFREMILDYDTFWGKTKENRNTGNVSNMPGIHNEEQLLGIFFLLCLLNLSAACGELLNWLRMGSEWIWCCLWAAQDVDNINLGGNTCDSQVLVTSSIEIKKAITLTSGMCVCQNLITFATPLIDIVSPQLRQNNWRRLSTPTREPKYKPTTPNQEKPSVTFSESLNTYLPKENTYLFDRRVNHQRVAAPWRVKVQVQSHHITRPRDSCLVKLIKPIYGIRRY